ncbi:helix-turn-helix domain-containing protein [Chryseobacterium binzhouense]|uniref:helix-turn-helix domain-containing protein n=1 Tax=Chryseobacterium binzhouense TaxID=2593646 RepID=UPI001E6551F0|nr:helix-turn-helix transcriptional regulator [Chryseobacterium binzhouense]
MKKIHGAMTLGEKLKKARISKNFTQEYLADLLQVSQKTYSNFENDKSKPDFQQVESIAQALQTSVLDFLSGDNITVNQNDNEIAIAQNYATINTSEKLIEQYEERIKELKEQVEFWKSRSQDSNS